MEDPEHKKEISSEPNQPFNSVHDVIRTYHAPSTAANRQQPIKYINLTIVHIDDEWI